MRKILRLLSAMLAVCLCACGAAGTGQKQPDKKMAKFTDKTKISEALSYPGFGNYGRLMFPADTGYMGGSTLGNLSLTWYTGIDPQKTVEILNFFKEKADSGEKIFFDIYSEEEMKKDPEKRNTGLFFFKGKQNAPFAICSAGGGFAFVGAMHDSFPHALELSKKGYNAFAIIYRPGAESGSRDLARAISFIISHAKEIGVSPDNYSLWGGSAGARLSAWLGSLGTEYFGEKAYPRPTAVIMQYTGLSEIFGNEPPTYNCAGTSDWIADYRIMSRRIESIRKNGTPAEIEIFKGLGHGFGLGTGTVAEGWIDNAAKFWQRQIDKR